MKFTESRISAHHNYVVNAMTTPGFALGDPGSKDGFFFLADPVLPGEKTHRVHGRLFEASGDKSLEILWNRIGDNPGGCRYELIDGGFKITHPGGEMFIEVSTYEFTNGYITYIRGLVFDEHGNPRMKPEGKGVRVLGNTQLVLDLPFTVK
ncbi:MAG: hypothetical protein R6U13_04125 [Desulfatiglandaceae bacterium]